MARSNALDRVLYGWDFFSPIHALGNSSFHTSTLHSMYSPPLWSPLVALRLRQLWYHSCRQGLTLGASTRTQRIREAQPRQPFPWRRSLRVIFRNKEVVGKNTGRPENFPSQGATSMEGDSMSDDTETGDVPMCGRGESLNPNPLIFGGRISLSEFFILFRDQVGDMSSSFLCCRHRGRLGF